MLNSISPLDGRYIGKVSELVDYFSEAALIKNRIAIEVEWLIFICNKLKLEGTIILHETEIESLRKLYLDFQNDFAEEIKEIEKTTKHDVKAVEYFLRKVLKVLKKEELIPFLHFACTSEDINNLAYATMVKGGLLKVMIPNIDEILSVLQKLALENQEIPLLSHTHGQAASPTTVGKEFKNFGARLFRQIETLKKLEIFGKMNGATGNFNAHCVAYPEVDWMKASMEFVEGLGFKWQKLTTQIEPHDYLAEIFDSLKRINVILIDLDRDIWSYVSFGYFKQKTVAGEVGSSTMPHKVNPIDFENSEGNLGLANSFLNHLSEKLPVSRMQRDLTDSTVLRNIGVAFGYSLLAYKSTIAGLGKLEINKEKIAEDLDNNWAILTEAIQTVMRRFGVEDAYEKLKELSRGKEITKEKIHDFVQALDIPDEQKNRLLKLTPSSYIGLANKF